MRSFLVTVVVILLLVAIASLALRSFQLGSLAATAIVCLVWSKQLLSLANGLSSRMGLVAVLWLLLIGIAAVLAARAIRRRGATVTTDGVTLLLNRASLLLLVVTIGFGLVRGRLDALGNDLRQGVPLSGWAGAGSGSSDAPDLFVILVDGYPRADILDYAFGLDNTPFVAALNDRRFTVASASHSDSCGPT